MEADTALEAYEQLHEVSSGTVSLGYIVADDNSSMRLHFKQPTLAKLKGTISLQLQEPQWYADHTH